MTTIRYEAVITCPECDWTAREDLHWRDNAEARLHVRLGEHHREAHVHRMSWMEAILGVFALIVDDVWARLRGRRVLPVVGLLLFTACATPTYSKPGITEAQWNQDTYACERDAAMLPKTPQSIGQGYGGVAVYSDPSHGLADAAYARRMFDSCMRARGYTREK